MKMQMPGDRDRRRARLYSTPEARLIHLAEPIWLVLLLLVPLPWLFDRLRPRAGWPTLDAFGKVARRSTLLHGVFPLFLRGLAIALIVIALARPQTVAGRTHIAAQGVAIVIAGIDQEARA